MNLTRRDKIELLLRHWQDFFDPSARDGNGAEAGDSSTVALLPRMSRHPSVVELARCVQWLRLEHPRLCAQVLGFYTAEWRTVDRPPPLVKGRATVGAPRVRVRVLPPWHRRESVERGVDLLVVEFRGEPFIPDELLALVA